MQKNFLQTILKQAVACLFQHRASPKEDADLFFPSVQLCLSDIVVEGADRWVHFNLSAFA